MLHKPYVSYHHVKNVFTNCFDVTVQLKLLAIQEHHAHLPLDFFPLPTFLVLRKEKE